MPHPTGFDIYQQYVDAEREVIERMRAGGEYAIMYTIGSTGVGGIMQPGSYMLAMAEQPGISAERRLQIAEANRLRLERQGRVRGKVPVRCVLANEAFEEMGEDIRDKLSEDLVAIGSNLANQTVIRTQRRADLPPILSDKITTIVHTLGGTIAYYDAGVPNLEVAGAFLPFAEGEAVFLDGGDALELYQAATEAFNYATPLR